MKTNKPQPSSPVRHFLSYSWNEQQIRWISEAIKIRLSDIEEDYDSYEDDFEDEPTVPETHPEFNFLKSLQEALMIEIKSVSELKVDDVLRKHGLTNRTNLRKDLITIVK